MQRLLANQGKKLIDKTIFDQCPNGSKAILPSNLFAFLVIAPIVRDGQLIEANALFQYFGSDFRLKLEAIGLDGDALENRGGKNLVAGFHVRQGAIIKN